MWSPNPPVDSDHENYDSARDELAVPDPYQTDFEPCFEHGLVKPPDVAARRGCRDPEQAFGPDRPACSPSAVARAAILLPSRGPAATLEAK